MTRTRSRRVGAVVTGAMVGLVLAVAATAAPTFPVGLEHDDRARLEAGAEAAAVSTYVEADPFPAPRVRVRRSTPSKSAYEYTIHRSRDARAPSGDDG